MLRLRFFEACLALLALSAVAHGHGFTLSLSGDQLVVTTGDSPVLHSDLFRHSIGSVSPSGPGLTTFTTNHGLFSKQTVPSNPFGATDTFRFDILGPVWFSNGGAAVQARTGVTLEANHTQSPFQSFTFDGSSSGLTTGFPVSATSSHHAQWVLDIDSFVGANDDGVYGFAYQISAFMNGDLSQPYDPVIGILELHTQGFSGSSTLLAAQEEVYRAASAQTQSLAVPEPPSAVAMLVSLALALGFARRKRLRCSE